MGLFSRRNDYDRTRILREGREAQRRGKFKKAVRCFRRILVVEPNSAELHALIAPALAGSGNEFSAWESYEYAVSACLRDKREKLALALYSDATQRMPQHYDAWKARAALQRRLGLREESGATLEAAIANFHTRATRYQRISLLRQWRELAPKNEDVKRDLSAVLLKTGQKEEALLLLAKSSDATGAPGLLRVRRSQ